MSRSTRHESSTLLVPGINSAADAPAAAPSPSPHDHNVATLLLIILKNY